MLTCHGVPSTCLEFSLYAYMWLLHSQGGAESLHELVISVFLQQLYAYAWSYDLPSNPFICLSSRISQSGSCTLGTVGHRLRPDNLDGTSSSSSKMARNPYTPY
jgi:hypothetical protein